MTSEPAALLERAERPMAHAASFLSAVDEHMHDLVARRDGAASDAARQAVRAGGKRLRPLLVLAARPLDVSEPFDEPAVRAAAAVELVHTASLIHDDVLDGAHVRRGNPTVERAFGTTVAIASGDLLFSLAFATLLECEPLAGRARTHAAVEILARTARTLAEGEAMQAEQAHDPTVTVDAYLERCARKTGVLFGAAMELGATFAGVDDADVALLGAFGTRIGVAFQVADDALDCLPLSAHEGLGKLPGADLRDGTVTLPLLLAARREPRVEQAVRTPPEDVDAVLALVRGCGAVAEATAVAERHADDAGEFVDRLVGNFDADSLQVVANRAVRRAS